MPSTDRSEPASAPSWRRAGLRPLAVAALAGTVLGAVIVAVVLSAAPRSPLDAFAEPPSEPPRESMDAAVSLFFTELDPETSLPLAGPLLLSSTERWDAYGFLRADAAAEGGQQVCFALVPPRPTRDIATGTACADRARFERDGLQLSVDSVDASAEATWSPDGTVRITDG